MTKFAGRASTVYLAATNGGAATVSANITGWSVSQDTDFFEVTSLGDTSKTYVSGFPGGSGTFNAVYDDAATWNFFAAAQDGLSRNCYIYPNRASATKYWYGQVVLGVATQGDVGSAITQTVTFNAQTPFVAVTALV